MKKFWAFILTLTMLLPAALSASTVADAAEFTEKPFYGVGWSDINRIKFPNLEGLIIVGVRNNSDGTIGLGYSGNTEPAGIAAAVKKVMDRIPEGLRYVFIYQTNKAFKLAPEDAIFMDEGIGQLKEAFSAFIKAYYEIGGQLDGIILDTEYLGLGSWYIYKDTYGGLYKPSDEKIAEKGYNRNIYHDIVANPKYATQIRPLLEEHGFKFYEEIGGNKSEIWSMFPSQYLSAAEKTKYSGCSTIWNTVMGIHSAKYLNDAIYKPLMEYYPNAVMSDYQETDSYAWLKGLSSTGGKNYVGGNGGAKVGNASNCNAYSYNPADTFYINTSGNYLYKNPAAYNKVEFEDDSYNMFMWDINRFKNSYAATATKRFNLWIAEYDYPDAREGASARTPYYTETLLHAGMLNPEPFLIYMWSGADRFKGTAGLAAWNERMQVISETLYELTRVAGYSDRTPIETPVNWNDGFVLSGMYTGGRNLWRLTPDTTDGATKEGFKVKDKAPTFSINGTTIVFPQGRIIADGEVSVVGTCGYWIETPAGVNPIITRSADHYSKNPSYVEDFNSYTAGTSFSAETVTKPQTWEVTTTADLLIENGALALTGTANLNNVKLPQNITAGDSYAKQQVWEVSVTLPQAANFNASVNLLSCGSNDGIKLEGGMVYYYADGRYNWLDSITLVAGQKYIIKRQLDFRTDDAYTSSYYVYSGSKLLGKVENVALTGVSTPVSSISISCTDLLTKVLIDDYKLYPTGIAKDFEVYNAESGVLLNASEQADAAKVAYRLSWMNATNQGKKLNIRVARYNTAGALVSDTVLRTVEMAPGADRVETEIVENTTGKVVVYLEDAGNYTPSELPNYDNGNFDWTVGAAPTEPTTQPTTAPTTAPTTVPTTALTTAPTTVPTTPSATTQAPINPTEPAEKDSGSPAIWVVIAVVVLAAAGVSIWLITKKRA